MYRYETHLHTFPVSACAKAGVREVLECYAEMGYDGVFITNHFLDGNINIERARPYEERIAFYFSDYEEAVCLGAELGIKVFLGVEMSYRGTDFLVYGIDKAWYLSHPEIMKMDTKEKLSLMSSHGALVVQAHPFREANYIDHIRLYPGSVHAVEVINANRTERENQMAQIYAEHYQLAAVAGTDNHAGRRQVVFAGIMTETPLHCVEDYIQLVKRGEAQIFTERRAAQA